MPAKEKKNTVPGLLSPDPENAEMSYALQLVNSTNCNVFLTGKAGTGKSTLLRYICANTKKQHIVLAPTGLAALNVGGQTIHSFFHLPLEPFLPDDFKIIKTMTKRLKADEKKILRKVELIVIDEVSMVRADLVDAMDKVLRKVRGKPLLPFGGVQLLFVGDLYQLEPVISPDEKEILDRFYPNQYFFSAKVFSDAAIVPIELKTVYRQEDSGFVQLLDRIRIGMPTQSDVDMLNGRFIRDYRINEGEMIITLCNTRKRVNEINEYHLSRREGKEVICLGIINGEMPERTLPTDLELRLKLGAQVIFVQNDPNHQWVNGSVGVIEEIDDDVSSIIVKKEDGHTVRVSMSVWNNVKYRYDEETQSIESEVIGSFQQFPLKLAWAITIHKSQGLTFDRVVIDFSGGSFAAGQAYVALSRCRSLEGIVLRLAFNPFGIIVRKEVIDFYRTANNQEQISLALIQAEAERKFVHVARLCNAGKLESASLLFAEALGEANIFTDRLPNRLLRYKLGKLTTMQQELQQLREQLREQELLLRSFADEFTDMGQMCMEVGEYEAALRNYKKALKLKPKSRRIKHSLAKALEQIKRDNQQE
ncbi:AAA family ATPase [Porphyromonas crevioricanis]|nr:AAA family ATPase [Porphyromonas crevioricanis]